MDNIEVYINSGDVERLFDAIHDAALVGRNSSKKSDKDQALDRITGLAWAGWRVVNTRKVNNDSENIETD